MSFYSNRPLSLSPCPKNLADPSCKTMYSRLRFRLAAKQNCAVSDSYNEKQNRIELPAALKPEMMPKHVAVIMDGNRRWAKSKGLPVTDGHKAGGKALDQLCRNCLKYGVKVLTVFAFSTENWIRPKEEIDFLLDMANEVKILDTDELMKYDVRLSFMGSRKKLPKHIQKRMSEGEEMTKANKAMHFVVALSYGGRYDITEATKKIATKVKHGVLQAEDVDDSVFEQHLETNVIDEFPNPDLLIRSSGELRISNFMLWQLAHSDMFFTNKLFPDFDETDAIEAITAFQNRRMCFGVA